MNEPEPFSGRPGAGESDFPRSIAGRCAKDKSVAGRRGRTHDEPERLSRGGDREELSSGAESDSEDTSRKQIRHRTYE